MLCRHNAQLSKALQHLNSAFQIAREERDDLNTAWAALHRFRLLAQLHSSDELAPMLVDVRRYVAKAGDPHVAAHMHDAVALMEASNGRTEEARRHLDISSSLIRTFPNSALEQIGLISASFVDFFECKFESAVAHLNAARRLVSITGARDAGVIECNLGHAMLVLGKFEPAEAYFEHVLKHGTAISKFSALEGLARVFLAAGHLARCEETLDAHDAFLLEDKTLALAFSGRWAASTRGRLLLKQTRWAEAAAVTKAFLEPAAELSDRILVSELTCLSAEAAVGSGKASYGATQLLQLSASNPALAGNLDAAFYKALGSVVSTALPVVGTGLYRRAKRIYLHQANRAGVIDLEPLIKHNAAFKADASDTPLLILTAIASALANCDAPDLIGYELTQLTKLLDCSPRAELVEGTMFDQAPADGHVVLQLGASGPQHTALRFEVPSRPEQIIVLSELIRIGGAAVSLQSFKRERRHRAALWPPDRIETNAGALFLAEEMQALLATARRVAGTNVPVLITGETGTGKEVLARAIHAYSNRSKAAFLPFNCTSTPRDLLDSQLFGHRRGSFTGAIENFQGIIRGAAGGTLFLDEIGDMALEVQPKLLRFLESGEVHPVGETQPVRADVRVIAATNANLDTLVTAGRFREDLFYRLNIVHLHIPPLRERRIEIPALAHHYLERYALEYSKGSLRLAEETMEYLVLYRWPGNVRQLANEMRRVAALCEPGAIVMPEHLSPAIAASRRTVPASERALDPVELVVRLDQPMAAATEHLERAMLQHALKECGGRMEETAARLGLSRKGLYLKRQRLGIEPPIPGGVEGTESAAVQA
jgi:DNA-binding NtrC family response regulator